jgi:membrane-associated phospholipid phosphatase
MDEIAMLGAVQRRIGRPAVVRAARGMSHFGEHALGWLAVGTIGAVADSGRRREWLLGVAAVAGAHGASIAVKRVVRRTRPQDERVRVLVDTPSTLSFPSSHSTSTTAAAVIFSGLTGRKLVPVLVPPMLASRMVLGVHYPSDVLLGSALGAAVGTVTTHVLRKKR